jgi:hypothetical protein
MNTITRDKSTSIKNAIGRQFECMYAALFISCDYDLERTQSIMPYIINTNITSCNKSITNLQIDITKLFTSIINCNNELHKHEVIFKLSSKFKKIHTMIDNKICYNDIYSIIFCSICANSRYSQDLIDTLCDKFSILYETVSNSHECIESYTTEYINDINDINFESDISTVQISMDFNEMNQLFTRIYRTNCKKYNEEHNDEPDEEHNDESAKIVHIDIQIAALLKFTLVVCIIYITYCINN